MKKVIIASILAIILFVVGFLTGCNAFLNSPKWVEEEAGIYLIVTEFFGNEYVDVAEKSGHMYNQFSFAIGRR